MNYPEEITRIENEAQSKTEYLISLLNSYSYDCTGGPRDPFRDAIHVAVRRIKESHHRMVEDVKSFERQHNTNAWLNAVYRI